MRRAEVRLNTFRKRGNKMAAMTETLTRTDESIRADVLTELKWDPKITSSDVAVAVKDGVVTLSGYVPSYWEKDAAEKNDEGRHADQGAFCYLHYRHN